MAEILPAQGAKHQWNKLMRIGALAAWGQIICLAVIFAVLAFLPAKPADPQDLFTVYLENWFVGLLIDDFPSVVLIGLYTFSFLGLWAGLRYEFPAWATLALVMTLIAVVCCFASDSSIAMLRLSGKYAAAGSETEKELLLAAGQAMIAANTWNSTAGLVAGYFLQVSGVLMAVLMVRSTRFARVGGYAGVVCNGLHLVQHAFGPLVPGLSAVALMIAGPFYLLWYFLIGDGLFRAAGQRADELVR